MLLILILLVTGTIYIETRRTESLVLDYVRMRALATEQAEMIEALKEIVEVQQELIVDLLKKVKPDVTPNSSQSYAGP